MGIGVLRDKIEHYRKKHYLNESIRGVLQFLIVFAFSFGTISLFEYYFWFDVGFRTFLFFATSFVFLTLFTLWIARPILKYFKIVKSDFSELELANRIGNAFPEINDKLVNALQLNTIGLADNSLINAGIDQYMDRLKPIPFDTAINIRINFKYLKYLGFIMLSMLLFSWIYPGLYQNSTKRLLNYQSHFSKPAPFQFSVSPTNLIAYRNEDFQLEVSLSGSSVPNSVYALLDNRRVITQTYNQNKYGLTIRNIQQDQTIQFEGGGFASNEYLIKVIDRSDLLSFDVEIAAPRHTHQVKSTLKNTGSISVPEGSQVTWNLRTKATNNVSLLFNDSINNKAQLLENQHFNFKKKVLENFNYEIITENEYSTNKDKINYRIDVIKDQLPTVNAEFYLDTILYEYVIVTGDAKDDYGISSVQLVTKQNGEKSYLSHPVSGRNKDESYYFQYDLDSIWGNNPETSIEVYVSASDNDAINGRKSVRSRTFFIKLPVKESIDETLSKKSSETGEKLDKAADNARSINEKIKELQERLLSKQKLEWQEEKLLNELLEQRKRIEESMHELQEEFEKLNEAQNKFDDKSEELKEKAKQLQQLMDEVLDDETKKLYEELQELMEENASLDEMKEKLDQLAPNEGNLEKELERALELFKRLKVEAELEKAGKSLEELSNKQQNLAEESETSDKEGDSSESERKSLTEEQEKINESFEKIAEQLKKTQELNQQLKNPEPLQDLSNEMNEIKEGLDKAKESLDKGEMKRGSQQQKQNSQKMKQMGQKLAQMMESMQMEMLTEDINNLRNILDNLVLLSFEQERLIDGFYVVTQIDPRFVELSQEQLKLRDDAKILEDSLLTLSERVVQISTFITREVGEVNYNIDEALESLRNRDRNKALSNQQFAMTSINNLALLLDDLLQQLQNSMASSSGKGQPKDEKSGNLPNLQQLQQQLSQQIQELKASGMKGRKLSEQLAKMAAQQEMLREKLNEMKKALNGQEGGEKAGEKLNEAMKLMEENEVDLVNKRLTQQLIDRQEKILTRMLDAEDALEEQEFDDEREAESADYIDRNLPKAFQEYLKERRKEIELLKTVPVDLNPFYKKEVNDYFRRISIDN